VEIYRYPEARSSIDGIEPPKSASTLAIMAASFGIFHAHSVVQPAATWTVPGGTSWSCPDAMSMPYPACGRSDPAGCSGIDIWWQGTVPISAILLLPGVGTLCHLSANQWHFC